MLSRRHLRIKVMQALYAFYQAETADLAKGEKELFTSLEKINELYLILLLLLTELAEMDKINAEDAKTRYHKIVVEPARHFFQNKLINDLAENVDFQIRIRQKKTELAK